MKVGDEELEWKEFIKKYKDKEAEVRAERETERLAVKAWIAPGAPEENYKKDAFPLPEALRDQKRTKEFACVPAMASLKE